MHVGRSYSPYREKDEKINKQKTFVVFSFSPLLTWDGSLITEVTSYIFSQTYQASSIDWSLVHAHYQYIVPPQLHFTIQLMDDLSKLMIYQTYMKDLPGKNIKMLSVAFP